MRSFVIYSFLILMLLPAAAYAEVPVPQKKDLQQQVQEIEKELGNTKDRLVKLGRTIQNNEKLLGNLEDRIADLEVERLKIQQDLKKDQKSISRLVLALERIKRVPPEALIAKPGAPLKTAQSAMLMGDIIPALNKQAKALKENLEQLESLSEELKTKKEKALATAEKLKKEEAQLAGLVSKRQKLYAKTAKDLEAREAKARYASKHSKTVKELVKNLEVERPSSSTPAPKAVASIPRGDGRSQVPLSGVIRLAYNQPDAFGAPSKGVEIEARPGSLIVVPMNGVVRFAGHFKNYGNMVIIEHDKGYHSLIAGFEKIDTAVGQSVAAGEPLGKLHRLADKGSKKPTLYYELRYNGAPVNPAKKFADLS